MSRNNPEVQKLTGSSSQDNIRELFYITHIANLGSILEKGIFSHQKIVDEKIQYRAIYNEEIVSRRKDKKTPDGKSLWNFSNLYFNARNPMLYRITCEIDIEDIAVLGIISRYVLSLPNIVVTDGNAASDETSFFPSKESTARRIFKKTQMKYWNPYDGSKRKIMAECLVPEKISPYWISSIYVPTYASVKKLRNELKPSQLGNRPIMCEPTTFFQPSKVVELLPKLSIKEGDMFFSRAQTLTISVNTVGVMGKGVASRAKWQFSDVYVNYQHAARRGYLKMGKPYLYKREFSTDFELADDPTTLENCKPTTWFLLFATKNHWRYDSDINGIEKGLQWIVKNYKKEGITSLALPALGCGLGNLNWQDVGPIMCKYMAELDIPVSIYLPMEKKIPDKLLAKEFLLPTRKYTLSPF